MSRTGERKHTSASCKCLKQVFGRARMGDDYSCVIANCTLKQCPVREVDAGVIDDFLKFVGALADDPGQPVRDTRGRPIAGLSAAV
jgi:hypothetical protein